MSNLFNQNAVIPTPTKTSTVLQTHFNLNHPPTSSLPQTSSLNEMTPMELCDDSELNKLVEDLMEISPTEVPTQINFQQFIDDLTGFDDINVDMDDDDTIEHSDPMDWAYDLPQLFQIISQMSSDNSVEIINTNQKVSKRAREDSYEIHKKRQKVIDDPPLSPPQPSHPLPLIPSETPLSSDSTPYLPPLNLESTTKKPSPPQSNTKNKLNIDEGLRIAKDHMSSKQYHEAISLLSKIYKLDRKNDSVLESIADCLFGLNNTSEAMEIYQKLAHKKVERMGLKEKIADCLTQRHDYLQANLIYHVIQRKTKSVHIQKRLNAKIQQNQNELKNLNSLPSISQLMQKIGINEGKNLTSQELSEISRFLRQCYPRAYLMWDLEMNKINRMTLAALEKDPSVEKILITLPDGSILKDSKEKPIHLYKAKDLALLAHFTKPSNAEKILDSHHSEKDQSPGEKDPFAFWNCQHKVCCSMVKSGSSSFYRSNNAIGIGFALHVPDPQWNIIHTWMDDCYTPTFFNSPGVKGGTGSGSEAKALLYNQFMLRFQVVTSYIYSVFQQADRIHQQLEMRDKFNDLRQVIQKQLSGISLIDNFFNKITDYIPFLDPIKKDLNSSIKTILDIVKESDLGDSGVQDQIINELTQLKTLASKTEAESPRSKAIGETITLLHRELTKTFAPREGGIKTRPTLYADSSTHPNKPLIHLYVDETQKLVTHLLDTGFNENDLFKSLFKRDPSPGETILNALKNMDSTLEKLFSDNKNILFKNILPSKLSWNSNKIWTRALTPKELLDSTKIYSEIGVRTHVASDEVSAKHAKFAGIILEEGMTIHKSGNQYIIDIKNSNSFLADNVTNEQVLDIIQKAHEEGLPCFIT